MSPKVTQFFSPAWARIRWHTKQAGQELL